jgi:hypothetical protein
MPLKSAKLKTLAAKTNPVVDPTDTPPAPATPLAPPPVEPSAPAPVAPPVSTEPPPPAPTPTVLDPDYAELKAFRVRYNSRHKTGEFADPTVEVKRKTRDELLSSGVSLKWARFVARFGFSGDIVYAMLRVLESPGRCHAGWFKEGEIAVRRAGLDLSGLNYEAIRGAVETWRAERKGGGSTEE